MRSGLEASVCIGTSSLGAGGSPGIPNHNQCGVPQAGHMDQSNTGARMSPSSELSSGSYGPGDTLEYFFERSVPDLLAPLALHFSFHFVNREVVGQRQRIKTGYLLRDTWNRYWRLCARRSTIFTVASLQVDHSAKPGEVVDTW
jgi:hypothetical protein